MIKIWRREGDSNPRFALTRTPLFESGTFDHSDTSPSLRIVLKEASLV